MEIFGHREKIAVILHRTRLFEFRKTYASLLFTSYRTMLSSHFPFNTQATTYLNDLPCGKCVCTCRQSILAALFRTLLATSDSKSTRTALRGKWTLLIHITWKSRMVWLQAYRIQRLHGCHLNSCFPPRGSGFICGAWFLRQWQACQWLQVNMLSLSHFRRKKMSLSYKTIPI